MLSWAARYPHRFRLFTPSLGFDTRSMKLGSFCQLQFPLVITLRGIGLGSFRQLQLLITVISTYRDDIENGSVAACGSPLLVSVEYQQIRQRPTPRVCLSRWF
jgi:hypothetical protein